MLENGATCLQHLIQAIHSKLDIELCCPTMLHHPFHLVRFIAALNQDGGNCAHPNPGAATVTAGTGTSVEPHAVERPTSSLRRPALTKRSRGVAEDAKSAFGVGFAVLAIGAVLL